MDVPTHRATSRPAAVRGIVVDAELAGEERPVVGKRDRVVRIDAGEVVPERERALRGDLDEPVLKRLVRTRAERVEDPVARRIAQVDAREVGIRDLTDDRSLRAQPDHEELVLAEDVEARREAAEVDPRCALDDRHTRLQRRDMDREAQPAGTVEVGDRVAIRCIQEGRTGVVLIDAAPVLDRPGGPKNEARREQLLSLRHREPVIVDHLLLSETLRDADLVAGPPHVRDVRGLGILRAARRSLAGKCRRRERKERQYRDRTRKERDPKSFTHVFPPLVDTQRMCFVDEARHSSDLRYCLSPWPSFPVSRCRRNGW